MTLAPPRDASLAVSASASEPVSRPIERVPPWLWIAAFLLVAEVGLQWAGVWGRPDQTVQTAIAYALKLVIEAGAGLWASRRQELPLGFRQVLGTLGAVSAISAVSVVLPMLASVWPAANQVSTIWYALSYLILAGAVIFRYPLLHLQRGQWFALIADSTIIALSLTVLQWLSLQDLLAAPGLSQADRDFLLFNAPLPVIYLIALTVIGVAGREIPSRRAFWWLFSGAACYLTLLLLVQIQARGLDLQSWMNAVYMLGVLPTLRAAWLIRHDAWLPSAGSRPNDGQIRLWNPLPAIATLGLGVVLTISLSKGRHQESLWLGVTLVVVTMLAVARVLVTSQENQRLRTERAQAEARAEQERMAAVGRLAGGIAHEFNSLMTAVIGHAELGALSLPEGSQLRNDLGRIRQAGDRAAALAARLLHFSGRQMHRPVPLVLSAHVHSQEPMLRAELPSNIALDLQTDDVAPVKADPTQVGIALNQLTANAIAAMPSGGTIRVRVRPVHLDEPLRAAVIPVVAGDYVALEVTDTGTGIAPEQLPHVFEPFFTTQPIHAAAGLGLAAVHGIMSAHEGGITLDSTVGLGTTVRLLWPVPRALGRG